jgi:hypothetical protein
LKIRQVPPTGTVDDCSVSFADVQRYPIFRGGAHGAVIGVQ